MRIALVYPECHRRGGVERVVWEAAHTLGARHEVTVVARLAEDLPPPVRVLEVPRGGWIAFRRAAGRALRGMDFDVTVAFGSDCPDADVLVMQSVHRAWLAYGGGYHAGLFQLPGSFRYLLPRHLLRLLLERVALRRARGKARIVAVSRNVVDDLRRFYGFPAEGITIVPNGFDPGQCSPSRRSALREDRRADLGIAPGTAVALLVANEYNRKGLGVLLEAMARLGDPRLHLFLVGRMRPDAYLSQISRLGLAERVRYCGPARDVSLYHAPADFLVLPTRYEAFGTVIVEALASGLPVITTALAGAATVVSQDRNGLLQQDPADASELAGLLGRALQPGVLDRWSEAAPASVAGYEWSSVMGRFEIALLSAAGPG